MKTDVRRLLCAYAVVIIVNIVLCSLAYIFFPAWRPSLQNEGHLVENMSAALYFGSALLGFFMLLRVKEKKTRIVYLVIPFLGLMGFLEEISFGESLFNIQMPWIGDFKINSLHELIFFALWKLNKHKYDYFWLYLFLFAFFSVAAFFIIRRYHRHFMQALKAYPSYRFVLFSIGFLFVAQIFDMHIIDLEFDVFLEELFELNGAVGLFFASLSIPAH